MFTGIIRDLGRVQSIVADGLAYRLTVDTPLAAQVAEGDSIAVNGVCLTVNEPSATSWVAHLMPETIRRTNLGHLQPGGHVNLERSLKVGDRLDGHFVQGHIDATVEVTALNKEGEDTMFSFAVSAELLPYLIPKGSVALDGVSLTIVDVNRTTFRVSMMPYTMQHTTFQAAAVGYRANLEVDMLGKYVMNHVHHLDILKPA